MWSQQSNWEQTSDESGDLLMGASYSWIYLQPFQPQLDWTVPYQLPGTKSVYCPTEPMYTEQVFVQGIHTD